MVNTTKEDELQSRLFNLLVRYGTAVIKRGTGTPTGEDIAPYVNELMKLITQYGLERGIDELIWSTGAEYKYDKDRRSIQDRIAELTTLKDKEK